MKKLLLNLIILFSSAIIFAQSHIIYRQDFESAVAGNDQLGNTQVKNFNAGGGAAWTYDIAAGVNAISGSKSAHLNIQNPGGEWWGLQYKIEDPALTTVTRGLQYNVTFKIKSSTSNNKFEFSVQGQSGFKQNITLGAANVTQVISINTSPMDNSGTANFLWAFGQVANVGDIWIDDIVITELPAPAIKLVSVFNENFENANVGPDNNLSNIGNTGAFHFGDQSAWTFGLNTNNPISGSKSAYLNITNTAPDWWALQYKVDSKFNVTQGLRYKVTFKIKSSVANTVTFKVQDTQNFGQTLNLKGGNDVETFSIISDKMDRSAGTANFIWGFGAPGVRAEVGIDDIVIEEMHPLYAPYVADISYCQGASAVPLTATPTSNNGLKWYSTATGETELVTAPTPNTTTPGTTTYYVAQVDSNGFVSSRDAINVTVAPAPNAGTDGTLNVPTGVTPTDSQLLEALTGEDTGGSWSHEGLTYTYTVAASSPCTVSDTATVTVSEVIPSAFTVCSGTKISALVGTTSLKFYADAKPATKSLVETTALTTTKAYYVSQMVGVQESSRVLRTVTVNALPATPGTITGTAAQGLLVGTSTEATYSISSVAGATSYEWTATSGVNIIGANNGTSVTVNFAGVSAGAGAIGTLSVKSVNASGCFSVAKTLALTKALPAAPAAIKMTDASLPLPVTGIATAVTSFAKYMGTEKELTLTATVSTTATSYVWELPTGVNVTKSSATLVDGVYSSGSSNVITVNFAGVTNLNTINYLDAKGILTNALRIGVKSVNGVGVSTTANSLLANSSELFYPNSTSTAKLLTLTAIKPAAPGAIKIIDASIVVAEGTTAAAVTDVSKYVGTLIPLTATATASALASSYVWELPEGVHAVSGSIMNSASIQVTFDGTIVDGVNNLKGVSSLYIGVKAVNGINSSETINSLLSPATPSTAKLLKVTAKAPATPGAITTPLLAVPKFNPTCATGTEITIQVPNVSGVTYAWTVAGVSVNNGGTNSIVIPVSGIGTTTLSVSVIATNGVGSSAPKTLAIAKTTNCSSARMAAKEVSADEFSVVAYPNPSSDVFKIDVQSSGKGVTEVQVYDMTGRLIEQRQAESNSVEVGKNYPSGIYNVIVNQGENLKTLRLIKK